MQQNIVLFTFEIIGQESFNLDIQEITATLANRLLDYRAPYSKGGWIISA